MPSNLAGYLTPSSSSGLPGGLTLNQFLQTVLVGISGLDGPLVRPKWQVAPAKQPDIGVSWMAFGVVSNTPDANSYVALNDSGVNTSQRHEQLDIQCAFYGPEAMTYAALLRDGFQIQQNLEALRTADMGFVSTGSMLHIPELVNERFIDRIEMGVVLRREIKRVYAILSFVSATGRIHTVLGTEDYLLPWATPEP